MSCSIDVSSDLVFVLSNSFISYTFRADAEDGELYHISFGGGSKSRMPKETPRVKPRPWGAVAVALKELPDLGRGDFRNPAIRIRHGKSTITEFRYIDHEIVEGKPKLEGLPATFAKAGEAKTMVVHIRDDVGSNKLDAYLSYTIFDKAPILVRSLRLVNNGAEPVVIERIASLSIDMPNGEWDMIHLAGTSNRETQVIRQKIVDGNQGFQSNNGFSSHLHNPFLALVSSTATETSGDAYGFSLVYSGSFQAAADRSPPEGVTRVMMGLNPLHLSWTLESKESFTTPECVATYSSTGLGGMSRALHRLYRDHLSTSEFTFKPRPALINNWEGTYFNFDAETLYRIASMSAPFGVKMFVMDDGWFGDKYPRVDSDAGLGDWVANPKRFPKGLSDLVNRINELKPSGADGKGMAFGLWVEPEMVNPKSELYEAHPDWVLFSGSNTRTVHRNQLILDLSRKEVQDYIIESMTKLLQSANIAYVKWDANRRMNEMPEPASAHAYMLGFYRVLDTLTSKFKNILWENCCSGGGRFDPGMIHYWPQTWTSDNTDGIDRLHIQFGNSMVYPPSVMTGHVSAVPNHQTGRTTPLQFRAHVAMMCGSFGFELDPAQFTEEEKKEIPAIIELSEKISPLILNGDLYRLNRPDISNWPAAQYVSPDRKTSVVLAYQMANKVQLYTPPIKLQGLEDGANYKVTLTNDHETVEATVDGRALMGEGLTLRWNGDYQSKVIWIEAA